MNSDPLKDEETIEIRLAKIESGLEAIQLRNRRVAGDKAWEVSLIRRSLVAAITYLVAAVLLFLIGNGSYLLNAAVPAAGYLLSTLTLRRIKQRWLEGAACPDELSTDANR